MALVVRRYRFPGVTTAKLVQFVAPSASVRTEFTSAIDAQVDDANPGTTQTLDDYMASLGYVFDATATAIPVANIGALPTWGNNSIANGADNRFLMPGYGTGLAQTTDDYPWVMPRNGVIRNLAVRHNAAIGNGASVVYTLFVNGVASALTVTLATGALLQAIDTTHSVVVVQGDRLSMQAAKAASIGNGLLNVMASVSIQ